MEFSFPEWLVTVLSSSAIIGVATFLFRDSLTGFIGKAIAHRFDAKLEEAKANWAAQQSELEFIREHLRDFRNGRSATILAKQILAAEELLQVVESYGKLTIAVETAKVMDFDKIAKSGERAKIASVLSVIVKGMQLDKSIEQVNNTSTISAKLYLDDRTLALFSAYKVVVFHAAMRLKTLAMSMDPDLIALKDGSLRNQIEELYPNSQSGFEEYGEHYAYFWVQTISEEIIKNLRARLLGEDDFNSEAQAISDLGIKSSIAQEDMRKKLVASGLDEGLLKPFQR